MKQRLLYLDAIKGLAILLVIFGHLFVKTLDWSTNNHSYLFEILAAVHMPLFILIAGYFSQKGFNTLLHGGGGYLKDKLIRLIIPALLWWIIWVYWSYDTVFFVGLLHLEYWFTINLFVYMLVFAVQRYSIDRCLSLVPERWRSGLEALLHILACLLIVYCLRSLLPRVYPPLEQVFVVPRLRMACLYPYFIIGFLLGRMKLMTYLRTHWAGVLSFCGLLFALACIRSGVEPVTYIQYGLWHIYRLLALSLFAFLVYSLGYLTEQKTKLGTLLVKLGQWSLPIYFVHYFFLPNVPDLRESLAAILPTKRISVELSLGLIGIIMTLLPTWGLITLMKVNPVLDCLFFGEKGRLLPKK